MPLQIVPDVKAMGCVPTGYIYSIKLKVTNLSPYPEKIKILYTQPNDEPNILKHSYMPASLAPGMGKTIQMELHATVEKTSKYQIVIKQETNQEIIKELVFFVVDPIMYKNISNTLAVADRRPYESCVTIVGKVPSNENSLANKSLTFSTALITDDDMEVSRTQVYLDIEYIA